MRGDQRIGGREPAACSARDRAIADRILEAARRVDDVLVARGVHGDVPEMTAPAGASDQHASVDENGAADAGAEREHDEVAAAASGA